MKHVFALSRRFLLVLAALLVAAPAWAQTITTGTLSGQVDDQQGGRVPGAAVQAVHVDTGTTYDGRTGNDGRFSILNVRVGVYRVKVTMASFKTQEQKDIVVVLGESRTVMFKLELERITDTTTVVAEVPPIDLTRAGTGGSIPSEMKDVLPTIARSITDLVRTNVYFNPMAVNDETPVASVAGRSQRYNSLQIDGAVNNDLFGLAAGAGVPGGSAGTQPISFDAIQEIQLVVSPYDVRQSGFSGGGINAITKTGTNELHGSGFFYGRNQDWVGKGVSRTAISTFSDSQAGFTLGGKIIESKAFFFASVDYGRRKQPSGFSINGTGVKFGNEALVDRFLNDLKTLYGYDLGPTAKDEYIREQNSDKIFIRTDFNIGKSQLTVRHNFVNARSDNGFPSNTIYVFPDGFNRFRSRTNSTVAQLTSHLGQAVNELRFALTTVRDQRDPQPGFPKAFPFVDVTLFGSTRVRAGLDGPSQANQLDQDIMEVTDDYTWMRGTHQFTVGTHNEFFKFRNLFINNFNGNWVFNSLDLFEQALAQGFQHSFSATSDPLQAAKFRVNHMGVYAGDQWRIRDRLTLTYGIRADFVRYPEAPNANPVAETNFGFRTDVVPNNTMLSPRAGFNYSLRPDGTEQIRGGAGLFAGRTPYVWISNQFGNTGVDFTRLNVATAGGNRIPFVSDLNNQPTSLPGINAATNEIDVIDPNFKYPQVIRGNIAYDRKLPFGLYGTAEVLLTSVVYDVRYENLNLQQISTNPVDGRPVYARNVVPTLSDVILLTNTDEGSGWTVTFEARRPFKNGLHVNGSYLYGETKSIADGVRDQAVSGWSNIYTPGDPNHPTLGRSDYDPGHRITVTASYDFPVAGSVRGTASIFYSGQSGRPYTLLWGNGASTGSVNGDTQNLNDILFLPATQGSMVITNGTFDQLLAYFNSHECTAKQIGTTMERNSCRSPWFNNLDAKLAFNLPFQKFKAELTVDMLNVLNFIDHNDGLFRYANFNDIVPVSATASGGVVTGMNLATLSSPTFSEFVRSDLRSRWQLQFGVRIKY